MINPLDSQLLESFVPVYDTVPDRWEDAKPFIVENLKAVSNAVNIREIGWFLDEQLITGKSFIPGLNDTLDGGTSQEFRTILRKVIVFPGLTAGVNTQNHGLSIDSNFSLIQLFGAATNAVSPNFTGEPLPNGTDTISYDKDNIIITVSSNWTRAWAVIEYIQEL